MLLDDVRNGSAPGTYAVAFGAVGGMLGAAPEQTAAALMLAGTTSMRGRRCACFGFLIATCRRQYTGCGPDLSLAQEAANTSLGQLRSFHPFQEIASMRHRTAPLRLFAS
jgi:urease accessory protein UreF